MDWNLIGHEWAVKLLGGHIKNNSLRQAYLISGPQGIGKQSLAIKFIQAILCSNTSEVGTPCFLCSNCQRLDKMEHPDLFPVTLEEGNKLIKVDQVRELMHSLSLSPYESKHKIGLIIDIEKASSSTQNALLKTLEEPPEPVILILTASTIDSVLETITSRCEDIRLNTVPVSTTKVGLEQVYKIPSDEAEFLAHISSGKPVNALNYYQDSAALDRRTEVIDEHISLLAGNSVDRFSYVNRMSSNPHHFLDLLNIWYSFWHDLLIISSQANSPLTNIDRQDDLKRISNKIDLATTKNTLLDIKRAVELINTNANLKLTLEDLLLQLPVYHA
jgi:DNA polymerase-3 subunit delta'